MQFNLFRKKKQPEPQQSTEKPAAPPQEEIKQEVSPAPSEPQEPAPRAVAAPVARQEPAKEPEQVFVPPAPVAEAEKQAEPAVATEAPSKTYLKAMPLRELADIENVKSEVTNGNIIILKVTPLASKSIEDVKTAIDDLYKFAEITGGDIARLGEERVVVCPKNIRIWREKTPAPVQTSQPLPTAA
jgi:uncharacterized protein